METKVTRVLFMMTLVVPFAIPLQSVHAQDTVFGQPIKLTNTASAQSPEIDVSGSNVYVVWSEDTKVRNPKEITNLQHEIYFRASNDNGETFSSAVNLSNIYGYSTGPKIASSGSNVYAAWLEAPPAPPDAGGYIEPGNYDVLFRASNDNGATFGPTINLSDSDELSGNHGIAVSGNNVYVIYLELGVGVFLRVSNDNGLTFNPPISLGMGGNLHMAASGNNVYVLGDCGMVFRASTDNGSTFGEPIDLGNGLCDASLVASGTDVYIVWAESASGLGEKISFAKSTDSGASFGSSIKLGSSTANSSWEPLIAISGNSVYVTWHTFDSAQVYDILFVSSSDDGDTFSGPINLSNDARYSFLTWLGASENNVYALWNPGVYFRSSTDNGANFGETLILNTNPSFGSFAPRMAISGGYLHAIWLSDVTGDYGFDIFYTRSPPTANSPAPTPPIDTSPTPVPSDPSSTTLEVNIDVKPASTSNTVNCATQKGSISVGLYTEDGFDAQDVDISTIELQGVEAKKYVLKDLDSDGDLDGLARFKKADLCESGEIQSLSTSVDIKLSGLTNDGTQFEGTDIIRFRR